MTASSATDTLTADAISAEQRQEENIETQNAPAHDFVDIELEPSRDDDKDSVTTTETSGSTAASSSASEEGEDSNKQRRRCSFRRFAKWLVITLITMFVLFTAIVSFGMLYEQAQVAKILDDTDQYYETSNVCVVQKQDDYLTFFTAPDADSLVAGGEQEVAHCGDCGSCSNPQDVAIYADTSDTLYKSSLQCGRTAVFGGAEAASRCLEDDVGFTEPCSDCWVENIM